MQHHRYSNYLRQQLSILLFLFILTFNSNAQTVPPNATGKISGNIVDSTSGSPIEYASICLFKLGDNKVLNGVVTDNKGSFKLTNIAEGSYRITVEFMGYKKLGKPNIVITANNQNIVLGNLKMASKINLLEGVTISADRSLIENKIDKMVYNAELDISSQSGVAADVLKKVPQISVDVDGNVELQGNSSIRFLIDGKPSILYGSNITEVLQSIPASQIQSIEVITSPGAKYDAEGTGGIINIILKKNKAYGMNGNIALSAGTRLENTSINLNMRRGKFGINAFLSGNAQLRSSTINKMNRFTQDSATSSRLIQEGNSNFNRTGYQSGIGFDWDITPKDNINCTIGYNFFENNNVGSATRETSLQDASGTKLTDVIDLLNTTNKFNENTYNAHLEYKKKFTKEDQEFNIAFNTSNGIKHTLYEQSIGSPWSDVLYSGSNGKNPGFEKETELAINYTQPFGKNIMFETGVKTEINDISSTSDVYILNTLTGNYDYNLSQSNTAKYFRMVYAGYASISFKVGKLFDIKTGIRNEYTDAKANFSGVGDIALKPYNIVVPSFAIAHTFKNKEMLKFNFSHRIERPDYRDLNPFVNAADPKNITTGSPYLKPEQSNKLEFSFSKTFKEGANINISLFYRGNRNDLQPYTIYYPTYKIGDSTYTNVAVTMRDNIGKEDNYGISLFSSVPITEKLNLRGNISGFDRYIVTGLASGGNVHGYLCRGNINASYKLNKTLTIEAMINYNSPRINAQGKLPSFTTYNFAFRKYILKEKGSIAFTATNFLNKYVDQKTDIAGSNFNTSNLRQLPYRSFGINFTYKFGKMEFKKEVEDPNLNPQGN